LQVKHRPVLPKSASWEPESSETQTEAGQRHDRVTGRPAEGKCGSSEVGP